MNQQPNLCPFCGCNLDVEKEVFSKDKLFTEHSCKGSELAKKKGE